MNLMGNRSRQHNHRAGPRHSAANEVLLGVNCVEVHGAAVIEIA